VRVGQRRVKGECGDRVRDMGGAIMMTDVIEGRQQ
jgi:hypothetical protein